MDKKEEKKKDKEHARLDMPSLTNDTVQSAPASVYKRAVASELTSSSHERHQSVPIPYKLAVDNKNSSGLIDELEEKTNREEHGWTSTLSQTNSLHSQRRSFLDFDPMDFDTPRSPPLLYSPKYASPPAGSGGKYMVRSKRASWIDVCSHDALGKAKQSVSPSGSDDTSLKSGSLSKLREGRIMRGDGESRGKKLSIETNVSEEGMKRPVHERQMSSSSVKTDMSDEYMSPLCSPHRTRGSVCHTPRRRSSMSMLRNMPTSELEDIVSGHSPNPILETPPAELITPHHGLSPKEPVLRKQLQQKRIGDRRSLPNIEADRDVDEIRLDTDIAQTPTEFSSPFRSPVYPGMLLNHIPRTPDDLYFDNENLRQISKRKSARFSQHDSLPAFGDFSSIGSDEDYAKELFMSRSAKVRRWCSLRMLKPDKSVRRRNSLGSFQKSDVPAILPTQTQNTDRSVNTIAWVDWLEEYKVIKAQEIRRRSSQQEESPSPRESPKGSPSRPRRDSLVSRMLPNWWSSVKANAEYYSKPPEQVQRSNNNSSSLSLNLKSMHPLDAKEEAEKAVESPRKNPVTDKSLARRVGYRFFNSGNRLGTLGHMLGTDTPAMLGIQQSIKLRLQLAKEACDAELRSILDGLNEYVERGLQYVESVDNVADARSILSTDVVVAPDTTESSLDLLEPIMTLVSEDNYLPTPFILTLQDLIALAQHVMDTSLDEILETAGACADAVADLQAIGARWDIHPEWPCREWYVRLLLGIAALNRVVEWWAAEKGFWSTQASTTASSSVLPSDTEDADSVEHTSRIEDEDDVPATDLDYELILQQEAEKSHTTTLILELSLDTATIQYVSPVWIDVVGSNPQSVLGHSMADFLEDKQLLFNATQVLLTPHAPIHEVKFHVIANNRRIQMEGNGMLMYNPLTGEPSHTMWVLKPCTTEETAQKVRHRAKSEPSIQPEPSTEEDQSISQQKLKSLPPVLCRVCERLVLAIFFERHSTLCVEIHQSEMDVNACNDSILELKHIIHERIENTRLEIENAELSPSIEPKPLQRTKDPIFGDFLPLEDSIHPLDLKRAELDIYKDLLEILEIALSISTPGTHEISQEDCLQSPKSKDSIIQVLYWRSPNTNDPTLSLLIKDVEELTKSKVDAVNRMRDRIEYNYRIRQDFQNNTEQMPNGSEFVSPDQDIPKKLDKHTPSFRPKSEGRKGLFDRIKSWRLKRPSSVVNRLSRRLRSLTPDAINTPIVEMETIDTPLGSPALRPKSALKHKDSSGSNTPNSQSTIGKSPLSPLHPSAVSRPTFPSIKDFDIIKPISKGAFGSVFLAKKRTTGDYYAIKFLKKSDMIAKNQVTNVKAERMILMSQTDSPFVTKLYYTFQSKDYLYLVLEYLNGGDCSALIKVMGSLPENWARNYLAEVTLGLEYLQSKNIVHRDLKPDNLLIDQNGHLKLTDFGLSRIGFLDRRVRDELTTAAPDREQPTSPAPSRSGTPPQSPEDASTTPTSAIYRHSYFSFLFDQPTSGMSTPLNIPNEMNWTSSSDSRHHRRHLSGALSEMSSSLGKSDLPDSIPRQAVGTPDYLAPESILGTGQDSMVDWWALGVICYEFIYGIPPFHAETPDKVFDNILSRRIDWHEDVITIAPETRDFMERLMELDPARRLGYHGAQEVKNHPFFANLNWDTLLDEAPSFIPQPVGMEDTDYFDSRGATMQHIPEVAQAQVEKAKAIIRDQNPENVLGVTKTDEEDGEFGTFMYKNLPVLEKANEDMIRKIRNVSIDAGKRKSISTSSTKLTARPNVPLIPTKMSDMYKTTPARSRSVSTPLSDPKVISTGSSSSPSPRSYKAEHHHRYHSQGDAESRSPLCKLERSWSVTSKTRSLSCLVADDNPISCKMIETILHMLHCQCLIVRNGAQAIRSAMSDVRYDIIFLDIRMPIIDGESAARMIKSSNNTNRDTPIVAATAYEHSAQLTKTFDHVLSKPVTKDVILQTLKQFCITS